MLFAKNFRIWLIVAGLTLLGLLLPTQSRAFDCRIGEDCFYGNGDPTGDGVSTWMGYAVRFAPPYVPYTVDAVSMFISQMYLSPDRRIQISILDDAGIRRQYVEVDWQKLKGHQGWVIVPNIAHYAYSGPFTVIVNSGLGPSPTSVGGTNEFFALGVDTSEPTCHSLVFTSPTAPSPPPIGMVSNEQLLMQGSANLAKLVPVASGLKSFPGGNWMIRAHSPGLQVESQKIIITMDDLPGHKPVPPPPPPPSEKWHMPALEGGGPQGMVRCPTSMAGITFYYWEDDRAKKFLTPHNDPWAAPALVQVLGNLCQDLRQRRSRRDRAHRHLQSEQLSEKRGAVGALLWFGNRYCRIPIFRRHCRRGDRSRRCERASGAGAYQGYVSEKIFRDGAGLALPES